MNDRIIHVCSLARLADTVNATGAGRLISLLTAGTPLQRPQGITAQDHLCLWMNDIADEQDGLVAPDADHVENLIEFAREWNWRRPLAIHCYAGVSRSTAAAFIVAAALSPERNEAELAGKLRDLSPSATPNPRLVHHADMLLGRQGRMVAAIASIGRGADTYEGAPFALSVDP